MTSKYKVNTHRMYKKDTNRVNLNNTNRVNSMTSKYRVNTHRKSTNRVNSNSTNRVNSNSTNRVNSNSTNSVNSNSTNRVNSNSTNSVNSHNPNSVNSNTEEMKNTDINLTCIPKGSYERKNTYKLTWKNKLAMLRVYETIAYYGTDPITVDASEGGECVWRNVGGWIRIIIRDVQPFHNKPLPHADFIYLAYSCDLSPSKANQLHRISGSIMYNSVSKILYAACHFEAASITSFVIVKLFNEGKISLNHVSDMYDKAIIEIFNEFDKTIGMKDQSKADLPLRRAYEKYLHTHMSYEDLMKILPSGAVLKQKKRKKFR